MTRTRAARNLLSIAMSSTTSKIDTDRGASLTEFLSYMSNDWREDCGFVAERLRQCSLAAVTSRVQILAGGVLMIFQERSKQLISSVGIFSHQVTYDETCYNTVTILQNQPNKQFSVT